MDRDGRFLTTMRFDCIFYIPKSTVGKDLISDMMEHVIDYRMIEVEGILEVL